MKLLVWCCARQGKKRCHIEDMPFKLWGKWLKPFNPICFPPFQPLFETKEDEIEEDEEEQGERQQLETLGLLHEAAILAVKMEVV